MNNKKDCNCNEKDSKTYPKHIEKNTYPYGWDVECNKCSKCGKEYNYHVL